MHAIDLIKVGLQFKIVKYGRWLPTTFLRKTQPKTSLFTIECFISFELVNIPGLAAISMANLNKERKNPQQLEGYSCKHLLKYSDMTFTLMLKGNIL